MFPGQPHDLYLKSSSFISPSNGAARAASHRRLASLYVILAIGPGAKFQLSRQANG